MLQKVRSIRNVCFPNTLECFRRSCSSLNHQNKNGVNIVKKWEHRHLKDLSFWNKCGRNCELLSLLLGYLLSTCYSLLEASSIICFFFSSSLMTPWWFYWRTLGSMISWFRTCAMPSLRIFHMLPQIPTSENWLAEQGRREVRHTRSSSRWCHGSCS